MADKDFEDFGITNLFRMAIDSHKVVRENREAHEECGHPSKRIFNSMVT